MDLDTAISILWRNALASLPLALIVAGCCRLLPLKPATRHALWSLVLLILLTPPMLPDLGVKLTQSAASRLQTSLASMVRSQPPLETSPSSRNKPLDRPLDRAFTANASSAAPPLLPSPVDLHSIEFDAPAMHLTDALTVEREQSLLATPNEFSRTQASSSPLASNLPDLSLQCEVASSDASSGINAPLPQPVAPISQPEVAAAPDTGTTALQRWLLQLSRVREALINVPPVPPMVWLAGIAVLLLAAFGRVASFRWQLRRTSAAPEKLAAMVNELSTMLGLRRTPRAFMSAKRMAPMVWCGRSPRLILPAGLWSELDDLGRRAVILHELAHLRRRDHWICWLSTLIGLAYWWNPLVWWCRRQIRDQADLSCDAWVTAFMPLDRRAYAQALLRTQRFINEAHFDWHASGNGFGLRISTPHAKRFARRLTMVMTDRNRPRMSRAAVASLCILAAGTFLTTPIWACPPDSQARPAAKARPQSLGERHVIVVPVPPNSPTPPSHQPAPPQPGSTFEQYMQQRGGEAPTPMPPPGALDQRLNQLERRLNQLTEQLHQVLQHQPHSAAPIPPGPHGMGGGAAGTGPAVGGGAGGHAGAGASAGPGAMRGPAIATPVAPIAQARARAALQASPRPHLGALNAGGPEVVRLYVLPEGKLEALANLMARSDVPVMIERVDGGINVQATEAQHETLRAFIELIHPEGRDQSRAEDLEEMYAPASLRARLSIGQQDAAGAAELAAVERLGSLQSLAELMGNAECVQSRAATLQGMHEHLWRAVEQLYQRAAELEAQAESMDDQASSLESQAEELLAMAEERSDEGRHHLRAQAEALISQARALVDQGRALEQASQEVEAQAERAETEAEAALTAAEEEADAADRAAAEQAADDVEND